MLEDFPPPEMEKSILEAIDKQLFLNTSPHVGIGVAIALAVHIPGEVEWDIHPFAECFVSKTPLDGVGYTPEDFTHRTGVFVGKKFKTKAGKLRYHVQHFTPEEFEKYISDPTCRVLLSRLLDMLYEQAEPDDDTIDKFTSIYNSRTTNPGEFLKQVVN